MGFFWGLVTGDWATSLGVCLFFELFWLDIFPAGTIIPPNSMAPALASLAVMQVLHVTQPSQAAVITLLALPLGRAFARLERYHRQYENEAFGKLIHWAKRSGGAEGPGALTRRSIMVMFPASAVAFALASSALMASAHLILPLLAPHLTSIPLKWPHLWVVASIGAVLSLRFRPAYVLLGCGVALATLSRLLA